MSPGTCSKFGQVAGVFAADQAASVAAELGTAVLTVRHAGHSGRIGAYVRSSRPMDPGRPVLLPGERERVSRAHARGVAVDDRTWRALTMAAGRHGLPMPPASAR